MFSCDYTVILVMYYGILILLQNSKMVRVGDVFCHDSSCSAQTKFNINSNFNTKW